MPALAPAIGLALALLARHPDSSGDPRWVVYEPGDGPGGGRRIVLVAGDEEYRSEEALPMLARILARRHGFHCTVLFSIDPGTGTIDPTNQTCIPGLHHLDSAAMLVIFTRFRELPDADMKHVADFVESGKPVLGLRTATHAFHYARRPESPYARYSFGSEEWEGGFGRQVLGETWVRHHGRHGRQSTRGVVEEPNAGHPILRGFADVWGPTDVYGVRDLPGDTTVLLRGRVLEGMTSGSPAAEGAVNDPMMPLVWTRETPLGEGRFRRVVTSTIGAATDLESAGLRRVLVNACYWGLGLEDRIPAASDVRYVGAYAPSPFGFGVWKRGVRPADWKLLDPKPEPKPKPK